MAKITYIDSEGARYEVEAENGSTVMENAIRNGVPGIEAECGGACACATCHVYVDEAFKEIVGEPEPMEEDMLDFAYDVRPTSRLSCQIRVRDELDGLTVTVPGTAGLKPLEFLRAASPRDQFARHQGSTATNLLCFDPASR